ncbi:hypothetical protein PBY51_005798 [Eleginops maclovinus]|uniref:Ig-like domain-containing protein n=1 Tax=Eleginops maclovinus TaxID=56733 RepID=A0AAN8A0G9_ELEMC|nr:hypothetical protein PBY51_005798 [Eleginops maclovinus]
MVPFVSGSTLLLSLAVAFLVMPTKQIEGRPQLIGSSQPIRAPLGGDVILPCNVQPQLSLEYFKVWWWRPDVPQDPESELRYVHLYPDEDRKMPSNVGRTEMFPEALRLGNASLRIRNLKPSDDGRYRCFIPELGIYTTMKLEVFVPASVDTLTTMQFPGNLQTADPKNEADVNGSQFNGLWICVSVLVPCILILFAFGYFLKHKDLNLMKYSVALSKPAPGGVA